MENLPDNIKANSSDQSVLGTTTEEKKKSKVWLFVLIPVVLIATLWIWKQVQINNIQKEAESDKEVLQKRAKEDVIRTHEQHLQLLSKPFVWAIRSEMLQGNVNQVHLYLNEMVKEKNFKNIIVANDKGQIISSTNKKFEGQPFASIGEERFLSGNSPVVEKSNDSVFMVSSPIMGFNNRLGTLMYTYAVPNMSYK